MKRKKKKKKRKKRKEKWTNTSLLSCPIVSCLCGGTWRCGRRRRRRRNGQHQRTHPRGMLVHPATSELNTQPVQNPLIISPRRTASCNFSLLFFFPPSLSFLTLSIYLLLLFFFPSLVNSYTRKDSPSFVHPINHFSLLFFHIFFFNYNNTSPARYIDCVVYAIVSSLAKSSRFLRTIIRTNRSSLFPLPCFFFFFPSSRRIRIVLRPFFSLHLSHSLFIAALACSTCVYALLLSQIFIYLFIFIYLLYIIYF